MEVLVSDLKWKNESKYEVFVNFEVQMGKYICILQHDVCPSNVKYPTGGTFLFFDIFIV